MPTEIDTHKNKNYKGRNARLLKEWDLIDKRFSNNKQIKYVVSKTNEVNLPIAYDIIFNMKSIIGVEEPDAQGLQKPVFGHEHIMRITLPNNYPAADGSPEFKFLTDIWHPNIRYFGSFRGRVCLNISGYGVYTPLVDYIDRVAGYLTYELYHAKYEAPYPEDLDVAEWVITQAEPQNWIPFKQHN